MKLIAQAIIAAGVLAPDSPEVAAGASFEAPDDIAATLIADGRAKEDADAKVPPADNSKKVKAAKVRVLVDGVYGKVNDVVLLDAGQIKGAVASGDVDPALEAVAYAESLKTAGA